MAKKFKEVPVEQLYARIDPDSLGFETTESLSPPEEGVVAPLANSVPGDGQGGARRAVGRVVTRLGVEIVPHDREAGLVGEKRFVRDLLDIPRSTLFDYPAMYAGVIAMSCLGLGLFQVQIVDDHPCARLGESTGDSRTQPPSGSGNECSFTCEATETAD